MKAKVIRLINNVHMGLSHDGLRRLCAKEFKIDLATVDDGHLIMFMNRKRDKLKIIGKQGLVIGYLRMPSGSQINLDAIQYIPQTFGAEGWDYARASSLALKRGLAKAGKSDLRSA